MSSQKRTIWARSLDATHDILIHGAKYTSLNKGSIRFEPIIILLCVILSTMYEEGMSCIYISCPKHFQFM